MTRSPRLDGLTTSIAPARTTKNGTSVWPSSISTSPRAIGRITPCAATRAICAGLSPGNRSAAFGELESGVESVMSVHIDPPDVAFDRHAVHLDRLCGRTPPDGARAHVELRAVPGARHHGPFEPAFVQRTAPVRAPGLDRAEVPVDVEHGGVPNQQRRSGGHVARAEL